MTTVCDTLLTGTHKRLLKWLRRQQHLWPGLFNSSLLSTSCRGSAGKPVPQVALRINPDGTACVTIDGAAVVICDGCGDLLTLPEPDRTTHRDSIVCPRCGFCTVLHAPRRVLGLGADDAGLRSDLGAARALIMEAVGARNALSIIGDIGWFYSTPSRRQGLQTLLQMLGLCDEQLMYSLSHEDPVLHSCRDPDRADALREGDEFLNKIACFTSSKHVFDHDSKHPNSMRTHEGLSQAQSKRRLALCSGLMECHRPSTDCVACENIHLAAKRSVALVQEAVALIANISGTNTEGNSSWARTELVRLATSLQSLRREVRATSCCTSHVTPIS